MDRKLNKILYLLQAVVFAALVMIDQITKVLARNNLNPVNGGKDIPLIKNVLVLHYLENRGSIWGILQGKVDFLLIVSVVLFVLLVYIYIRIPKVSFYLPLLWLDTLMIAGAVGNTIDRIVFGYVTDFIYVEIINFPVFNGADCWITIATFATIIMVFTKYKNDNFEFLFFKKKTETGNDTDNT